MLKKLGAGNYYNRRGLCTKPLQLWVPFWNNFVHKTSSMGAVGSETMPIRLFLRSSSFSSHTIGNNQVQVSIQVFAADISRIWGCWLEKCHQMHIFTLHVCKISTLSLNMWIQCRVAFRQSHYIHTSINDRDRGGICFHRQISFWPVQEWEEGADVLLLRQSGL